MTTACWVPGCAAQATAGDLCPHHHAQEVNAMVTIEERHRERMAEMFPGRAELAYWARRRETEERHAAAYRRAMDQQWDGDGTPYGLAAMRGILHALGEHSGNGRNVALNKAAWMLGQLVAGNELALEPTRRVVFEAGRRLNLPRHEVKRIVDGAFRRGMDSPRTAPAR